MWTIFQEEDATNVIWVWTPNAAGFKDKRGYTDDQPPAPFFYAGDEDVDWIASDGYNWGVSKRDQGDRWRHVSRSSTSSWSSPASTPSRS